MSKYIATRLHKAIELAPDEEFFQRCSRLPHYVIDASLIGILGLMYQAHQGWDRLK